MRAILTLLAFCTAVAAWAACGGESKQTEPTAAVTVQATKAATGQATRVPAASATGSASGGATSPAGGQTATVEVTGIVGTVSTGQRLIEINRLSGANVRRISVDSSTVLRKAAGGTTTLGQIRASDRIIARGTLNGRGDTLEAGEITVQDAIPGAQPGG